MYISRYIFPPILYTDLHSVGMMLEEILSMGKWWVIWKQHETVVYICVDTSCDRKVFWNSQLDVFLSLVLSWFQRGLGWLLVNNQGLIREVRVGRSLDTSFTERQLEHGGIAGNRSYKTWTSWGIPYLIICLDHVIGLFVFLICFRKNEYNHFKIILMGYCAIVSFNYIEKFHGFVLNAWYLYWFVLIERLLYFLCVFSSIPGDKTNCFLYKHNSPDM